jgi:formylglycine-generating enzyme required for sulfatase activity
VAICSPGRGRSALPLGQRVGSRCGSGARQVTEYARSRSGKRVNAHSKGVSPFGVMDMVGNVWQRTEEFAHEHTRAAIRRGGSYYQPQGSIWYFPKLIG